jgi:hypothetical protein
LLAYITKDRNPFTTNSSISCMKGICIWQECEFFKLITRSGCFETSINFQRIMCCQTQTVIFTVIVVIGAWGRVMVKALRY